MATSRQLREQIAAGRWDAALAALYGGSEEVLARQRSRYGAALEQFELYYGPGRQVQVYSAPGRTELGGNHTDHQHGYGLAGAVTLDLVAVASRNEDGFIRVKSRGFNKLDVIDLTEAEPQQGESTHSASLIRGIAEGFRAKGCDVGGFDAYTASDVLRGSGLSSSAAFEMGVAMILNTEYGCGLDAPALARICQFAENTYFGKPSGLMDQMASSVGGAVAIDFADPLKPEVRSVSVDLEAMGYALCIIDSGASHAALTGEYASIPEEMGAVAEFFGKKVLREVDEAEFMRALPELRRAAGDRAVLRAMHFFADDRRSAEEADALERGEVVCMMGDRCFEGEGAHVEFLGEEAVFPYAAFYLAARCSCPVLPLFAVRERAHTSFIVHYGNAIFPKLSGRRRSDLTPYVREYVSELENMANLHPYRCFLFENIWSSGK